MVVLFIVGPYAGYGQLDAGIIGKSQCVTSGNSPSAFTSIRSASGGTISWEKADDNAFTSNRSTVSTGSQTFTEGALTADKYYRRVVTNGTTSVYSNIIRVAVVATKTDPTFTPTILALPEICQQTPSFSVSYTTTNSPDKYSLYWDATASTAGLQDVTLATLGSSPGNLVVSVPSNIAAGTYNGSLVAVISGTGCTVSNASAVKINSLPSVVISAPAAICSPGTIDLTSPLITSAGSTANLSYTQWNNAAATSSLTNASAVTVTGVYYIKGTISATGCAVTKPVTATINSLPTVVTTAQFICTPGTIDLTNPSVTSAGSTANLSYTQWNNAVATSSLTNASAITNTGIYYIKGTIPATGCSVTKPVTATINPLPTVVVTAPAPICQPGTIDLTSPLITSAGSTTNLSYTQWNDAAATSSLINASGITATGVYFIKGTIPATGCSVTKPVTATINPLPTVVTTAQFACTPGTIDLTSPSITSAGSTANLSYTQWNNATATSSLTNASGITATGVYYIKGIIPATGCAVTKAVTATVNVSPTLLITNPPAVCEPGTINLTATAVTNGSTPGIALSYWTNAVNTNVLSAPAAVSVSGIYYIKGTVTTTGCAVSQPVTVTINPLPNGVLQNPSVNNICSGSSLLLNASNAFAYQWYYNQQPVTGAVTDTYAATIAGDYTVRFISKDGCIKDAGNTITLGLLTQPVLQFKLSSSCAGSPISFNNSSLTSSSGNINWQWDFGDGSSSNAVSPTYTYPTGGNYTISLTANNTSCSTFTQSLSAIYTIESPRIPTRYTTVHAVGGVPVMLYSRNAGNVYLWQPSTGLNDPTLQFPTATLDKDLEYTILINSAAGCTVTDTVLVKVALDGYIYVGQGFTPNGDGVNDRCYPITVGIRSLTYFKIFNRWGNLVFQTNDVTPQNGWDGKLNGKLQPPGTYQWVAEAIDGSGNIIKKTGSVLLIN